MSEDKSIEQQVKDILLAERLKELDAKISILELMGRLGTLTVLSAIEEICDDETKAGKK